MNNILQSQAPNDNQITNPNRNPQTTFKDKLRKIPHNHNNNLKTPNKEPEITNVFNRPNNTKTCFDKLPWLIKSSYLARKNIKTMKNSHSSNCFKPDESPSKPRKTSLKFLSEYNNIFRSFTSHLKKNPTEEPHSKKTNSILGTPKWISKENWWTELKSLESPNESKTNLNQKWYFLLTEDDSIWEKENMRANRNSFNFEAFVKPQAQQVPSKDTWNKYTNIIRSKLNNENKAYEYISLLRKNLAKTEKQYMKVFYELNNWYKENDKNKLTQSLKVNCNITTVNSWTLKLADRSGNIQDISDKTSKVNDENDKVNAEAQTRSKENESEMCSWKHVWLRLEKEIKKLKHELKDNWACGINYYWEWLKKGTDTRNEGLVWIVRRWYELNYEPDAKDFPNYFTGEMIKYITNLATKQTNNVKWLHKLQVLKAEIKKNNAKFKDDLAHQKGETTPENKHRTSCSNEIKSTPPKNKGKNEWYIYNKMKALWDKYDYSYINNATENKIQLCLKNSNIHKYKMKLREDVEYKIPHQQRVHSAFSKKNKQYNHNLFLNKTMYNNENIKIIKEILEIKEEWWDNELEIDKIKNEQVVKYKTGQSLMNSKTNFYGNHHQGSSGSQEAFLVKYALFGNNIKWNSGLGNNEQECK